ncbi:response regulator [Xanthomonas translucens pv. arrhenatheri]|uniref:Response regulator n=1 Tax=Xanthomonas graminis pv. arrhenatheri LMG 727 TaxID=1195923 RepID=A0A0K3A1W7_9XANT|nr:HD domain-containing phosphohydrolase [Xanthomonas translucens]OAX66245.1 response regulator [Xanthomonas translucens pv. arrhenatheri]UKE75888.1 response regulator [Xanthomonas translucens pv. arrhenatheri]CTP91888.1 response regulator [Xanthomonas translucens pv. arrhenatheri LMG 727]
MSEPALPRILCVDDEPNLLAALERNLFGEFDVVTADGGEAGLAAIAAGPPFAAIVSDMRMPGMDGAAFLAAARARAPDSVRLLLTGQADATSAIAAINQGAIFRFLCKPCPTEELVAALEQAVALHRATLLERELLETTLAGTTRMLTEVLSMVAPWAFQRSAQLQACVSHVTAKLPWPNRWVVEVAAALSHIGCVSVPGDIVQREIAGDELSEEEQKLIDGHPLVAYRLLTAIPRMQAVAEIVRYQTLPPPADASPDVVRGAQLLRASLLLVRGLARKLPLAHAVQELRKAEPPLPRGLIDAFADLQLNTSSGIRKAKVCDLVPGWRLEQDVVSKRGMMLLAHATELSLTSILALRNLQAAGAIVEPLLVSYGNQEQSGAPVAA